MIADADQAAGGPLGFLNPVLYKAYDQDPGGVQRHQAAGAARLGGRDPGRLREHGQPLHGYIISLRAINYAGPETYCDATGNCATRNVTLTTTPGFDSLTGLGSVGSKFISTHLEVLI